MPVTEDILKKCASEIMKIKGATGTAVGDTESGMCLHSTGEPGYDLDLAVALNMEVIKTKKGAMKSLRIEDSIDDILITLGSQYHLLRLIKDSPLYVYLVLDRDQANLAMARHGLFDASKELV